MTQRAQREAYLGRMREAAFVGWQINSALSGRVGSYDEWLRLLRLHPTDSRGASKTEVKTAKERSAEVFERARAAFKRGVRKERSA